MDSTPHPVLQSSRHQPTEKLMAHTDTHTDAKGRVWRPYVIEFKSQDSAVGLVEGCYSFTIYALSFEHADLMLDDLRATATVKGELVHRSTP